MLLVPTLLIYNLSVTIPLVYTVPDINECVEVPELCGGSEASVCTNTDGGYTCTCKSGYQLSDQNVCKG